MNDEAAQMSAALQALSARARRPVRLVLVLVLLASMAAVLVPMRLVAQAWSDDDVEQCRSSAFVEEAATADSEALAAAMKECRTHRRNQRWGPWGVFGDANDGSPYTAPDD